MARLWLHRCAVLLASLAFLSLLAGSVVTSNEERPFYSFGQSHIWLGAAIGLLAVVLALCVREEKRLWLRRLCWCLLAAVVLEGFLGFQPLPQAPAIRIAHAFVGQLFFSVALAIAVCTSSGWRPTPARVEATPSLWLLATIAPVIVLGQVLLGTLFRHGALEVGPHIIGAFVVALLVLGLALSVINRPEHQPLHLAARWLLAIALTQVFLGLVLFSMQVMDIDPSATILVTMIHLAMGASTLAATVMMAVLVRHWVIPPQRGQRQSKHSAPV